MQRAPHGHCSEPSNSTTGLTPFQFHLLRRLDVLLTSAVPAATEAWQIDLVGHALRHTLNECAEAGMYSQVTARLRAAGRGGHAMEGQPDIPESSRSAGPHSN